MRKILVTGGTGLLGTALKHVMPSITCVGSKDYNLLNSAATDDMFEDHEPDVVIHLAAKVGGVKANTDGVADFYHYNSRINDNVLSCANRFGVSKVVSILSTCIYPDNTPLPICAETLHEGPPHPSNFGYAYAKRMLEVQTRAYNQQYGREWITVVPNNIYGPHDNFDLENGHVIPAIIRKIYEAKHNGTTPVFWGSGKPLRQFTYSFDIARMILWAMDNWNGPGPLNIGNSGEYSISNVVRVVCKLLDFPYDYVLWDKSKPEGQYRKPSKIRIQALGYANAVCELSNGLKHTCNWFRENYPSVRGVK